VNVDFVMETEGLSLLLQKHTIVPDCESSQFSSHHHIWFDYLL